MAKLGRKPRVPVRNYLGVGMVRPLGIDSAPHSLVCEFEVGVTLYRKSGMRSGQLKQKSDESWRKAGQTLLNKLSALSWT